MAKATIQQNKKKTSTKNTKEVQRISAKLSNLRISPRKVRLMAGLIKGMSVDEALLQLKFRTEKSARPLETLLTSALANAENNAELMRDNLKIEAILVDPGKTIKRFQPRAQGRAYKILKRSSHITIQLAEIEAGKKSDKKKTKTMPAVQSKSKKSDTAKPDKEDKTTDTKTQALSGTASLNQKGSGDRGAKEKGFSKKTFHRRDNM